MLHMNEMQMCIIHCIAELLVEQKFILKSELELESVLPTRMVI